MESEEIEESTSRAINCYLGGGIGLHVLRSWIERYGIPHALYTDWKAVYVRAASEAEKAAGKVPLSQFGRMANLEELGCRD